MSLLGARKAVDASSDMHDTTAHVDRDPSSGHGVANGQAVNPRPARTSVCLLPKRQPQVSLYRILLDVEVSTFQQTPVEK